VCYHVLPRNSRGADLQLPAPVSSKFLAPNVLGKHAVLGPSNRDQNTNLPHFFHPLSLYTPIPLIMPPKNLKGAPVRRRGRYQPACDLCSKRKSKCGGEPGSVCAPCRNSGRGAVVGFASFLMLLKVYLMLHNLTVYLEIIHCTAKSGRKSRRPPSKDRGVSQPPHSVPRVLMQARDSPRSLRPNVPSTPI
jgi:hypothetical protein